MPDARRGRRESGADQAVPRRIHRFLEPCLLLLLHCNEVHGYELMEGLNSFGFDQKPVDSSTVYRMLRELEGREFVTSRWETDTSGPARRLYSLTAEGDRYLARWVEDLRETDRVLHDFLTTYDAHMEIHQN
jgi:PadR family transcriptional regulator PadR